MNNMIDLTPYISDSPSARKSRSSKKQIPLAALVESIVTVLLGMGIFFVLTSFVAAI